ncbi:MAG: hypothetical protein KAQ83_02415 [Nanoarchaeota archaeon]|nr:hypothetical protein [Nanoarchaeota archaeon]
MAERDFVVNGETLTYEGIFRASELLDTIDQWTKRMHYDKKESKALEVVKADGKHIEVMYEPWKDITSYAQKNLSVRVIMHGVKDVNVRKDGHNVVMNQGKVKVIFYGILKTDWEHRWENKPMMFFLRSLYNKFFYNGYVKGWRSEIKSDTHALKNAIKAYLNLNRYR